MGLEALTHLEALLFTSFTFFVIGILSPIAVAVRVVREERVVRLARCLHVTLRTNTQTYRLSLAHKLQ